MQAQRTITDVTSYRVSMKLPEGFRHDRIGALVLRLDDQKEAPVTVGSHLDILDHVQILGANLSSTPEEAWRQTS